ncbi:MAG: hypothetical protein ABSB63_21435 [Spirochaetia bacterium]|jgi:hypothetical protein
MKRLLLVLALVCLTTVAFAFDIGAGLSGSYYMSSLKAQVIGIPTEGLITGVPFNFMAFVDAGYLQFNVGYRMVDGYHAKAIVNGTVQSEMDVDAKLSYVSIAGYGKFPIELGPIVLFPMVGIEYDLAVAGTSAGTKLTSQDLKDATEFWIKAGVGADIPITPQFYLRPELMLGYKLLSGPENDEVSSAKASGATDVSMIDLSFELAVLFGVKL